MKSYIYSTVFLIALLSIMWSMPMDVDAAGSDAAGDVPVQTKDKAKKPANAGAPEFKLVNVRKVTDEGDFVRTIWSPTDPDLLRAEKMKLGGVYLINIADNTMRLVLKDGEYGSSPRWSMDGKHLLYGALIYNETPIYEGQYQIKTYEPKSLDVKTGDIKAIPKPDKMRSLSRKEVAPGVFAYWSREEHPTMRKTRFVRFDGTELAERPKDVRPLVYNWKGDVIVEIRDRVFNLTEKSGGGYVLGQALSPDWSKVAFTDNGEVFINNLDGTRLFKGVEGPLLDVGDLTLHHDDGTLWYGSISAWHPDNRHIIIDVGREDKGGDYEVESEIFIQNIHTGKRTQLTNTPDILESGPRVSSDGRHLAFEVDGTIYVGELVRQ